MNKFLKSLHSLQPFMPPVGTTKVVKLTNKERKEIGKKRLSAAVASLFQIGDKVTVKTYGVYYTIELNYWGFRGEISSYNRGKSLFSAPSRERLAEQMMVFEPTVLVRISKLLIKQRNDWRSLNLPLDKIPSIYETNI